MLSTEAYGSALPAGSGRMKEGDGLHRPEAWKETVAALEARECPREPESTRRGPESARGDGGARVPERRGGNACPRNLRVASTPRPALLGQHPSARWLASGRRRSRRCGGCCLRCCTSPRSPSTRRREEGGAAGGGRDTSGTRPRHGLDRRRTRTGSGRRLCATLRRAGERRGACRCRRLRSRRASPPAPRPSALDAGMRTLALQLALEKRRAGPHSTAFPPPGW